MVRGISERMVVASEETPSQQRLFWHVLWSEVSACTSTSRRAGVDSSTGFNLVSHVSFKSTMVAFHKSNEAAKLCVSAKCLAFSRVFVGMPCGQGVCLWNDYCKVDTLSRGALTHCWSHIPGKKLSVAGHKIMLLQSVD